MFANKSHYYSYVISKTDKEPESLSATEQSILITSPASKTTFPPDNNSNEDLFGISTSLIKKEVPFWTLLVPPLFAVVLTNSTSAVTDVEWIFVKINPRTTVEVTAVESDPQATALAIALGWW